MRPEENTPTPEQLERVAKRNYRAFIRKNKDGSEDLITVYPDSSLVHIARKSNDDPWGRWGAPTYGVEIYE